MWHKRRLANVFSILGMAISPPWRVWSWTGNQVMSSREKWYWTNQHKMKKIMLFDGFILETKWKISRNQNHMSINDIHGVSGLDWDKYCKKNWWLSFESKCRPQIPNISIPEGHVNSICWTKRESSDCLEVMFTILYPTSTSCGPSGERALKTVHRGMFLVTQTALHFGLENWRVGVTHKLVDLIKQGSLDSQPQAMRYSEGNPSKLPCYIFRIHFDPSNMGNLMTPGLFYFFKVGSFRFICCFP